MTINSINDHLQWPPPTTLEPPRDGPRPGDGEPPVDPICRSNGPGTPRRLGVINVTVVVLLIAVSTIIDRAALLVVPLLFAIVVPFEKLFPRHRGQRIRRPGVGTDIAYALASPVLNAATIAVAIVVGVVTLAWLPGLAIRPLVGLMPKSMMPFVGFAVFDLTSYWVHRWAHEVPILWKFHAIHHSADHMDWVSGFRSHPAEGAILAPPFVFLLSAGFNAAFVGFLTVVQVILGLFVHANVKWRLRPLDRIVITPEFHHWHHSNEVAAHRTNYSIFLPVWDSIFGTYRMPANARPTQYGVDEFIPSGMTAQLWWPFRSIGSPMHWMQVMLRHPVRAVRGGVRTAHSVSRDVWRSTRRPTRRASSIPDFDVHR
jgi:sterol desaturase/sphingolipid hydroxylase (fatty acid hydroxylase superfamily)